MRKNGRNSKSFQIPEETIAAIIILYKNTKAMVCSFDGDTDFFNVLVEVLQGDSVAIFIISLGYVLRTSVRTSVDPLNEIDFTLEKSRRTIYSAEKIAAADYADDLALITNKIEDAEKLLLMCLKM